MSCLAHFHFFCIVVCVVASPFLGPTLKNYGFGQEAIGVVAIVCGALLHYMTSR
jgi:hypothetical protein